MCVCGGGGGCMVGGSSPWPGTRSVRKFKYRSKFVFNSNPKVACRRTWPVLLYMDSEEEDNNY